MRGSVQYLGAIDVEGRTQDHNGQVDTHWKGYKVCGLDNAIFIRNHFQSVGWTILNMSRYCFI